MSVYASKDVFHLVGRESTYGTAVATDKDLGLLQSLSLDHRNNLQRIHGFSTRNANAIKAGNFEGGGTMEFMFQHGRFLDYATGGTVTHDASSTPDIKHTYAEGNSISSATMRIYNNATNDVTETLAGLTFNNIRLLLEKNGLLKWSTDFLCKQPSTVTTSIAASPSVPTINLLGSYEATVKTGTSGSRTAVGLATDAEFTLANNDQLYHAFSSRLPQGHFEGDRDYDFKFTLLYSDTNKTEEDRFLGSTGAVLDSDIPSHYLELDITNNVALASGRRQLNLVLADVTYDHIGKRYSLGELTAQEISGWAKSIYQLYTYDNITSGNWG